MKYFEKYSSNTYAASGNQFYFKSDNEVHRGRIFYKVSSQGIYNYSILFSNIIDSTFADGAESHCNLLCDSWSIEGAHLSKCSFISEKLWSENEDGAMSKVQMASEEYPGKTDCEDTIVLSSFMQITFGGNTRKDVMPGEFFCTDAVSLELKDGEYLCMEISYKGLMIPCHQESLIPAFEEKNGYWEFSRHMPFPAMIGCDQSVKLKIGYLGDSITQGIGTDINSYAHWNAILSQKLPKDFVCWNLGLGFGRASDAASDGAWLYKAKQNDLLVVCFGVNDILWGRSTEQIINDINKITDILIGLGKIVLLQTIPPFNYIDNNVNKWISINEYIKTVISKKNGVTVFDNVPFLQSDSEHSYDAKYGGHPNAVGCSRWADEIFPVLEKCISDHQKNI